MIDLQMQGGTEVVSKLDRLAPRVAAELAGSISRLGPQLTRIIRQTVEKDGDAIAANVLFAAPHAGGDEFGVEGIVSVRQRLRQARQAFRRSISPDAFHPPQMDLPQPSFLRSALGEFEASGAIQAEISASLGRAKA
jgi:hypothetical protein